MPRLPPPVCFRTAQRHGGVTVHAASRASRYGRCKERMVTGTKSCGACVLRSRLTSGKADNRPNDVLHPITAFIAFRYLGTRRKNRFASFVSLASVLGIGLGVAVLIIVASVMNGFEKEVTRHILGMTSHAVMFRPGATMDDWQEKLALVESEPDVTAGAPFIRAGAMLNHKGNVRGVSVQGIDTETEHTVSSLPEAIDPVAFALLAREPNNILLGRSLAENLEVAVGNTITLIAPRWNSARGIEIPKYIPLKVIGTFSVGMHEFDAGFALLSIQDAARIFGLGDTVSGIRVRFADPALAPERAAAISNGLNSGVVSVNWTQFHRNFFHALKSQKRIMFVILSLIVAVAAFNIVASMVMIVKEKDRDIAVLRTLGLGRRAVMLIFVLQGVVIGIAGIALGVITGAWGASQADQAVAAVEDWFAIKFIKPDVYYIDYLPADVRAEDIVLIASIAFVICVIATLYPAWQAARTAPAAALRYE